MSQENQPGFQITLKFLFNSNVMVGFKIFIDPSIHPSSESTTWNYSPAEEIKKAANLFDLLDSNFLVFLVKCILDHVNPMGYFFAWNRNNLMYGIDQETKEYRLRVHQKCFVQIYWKADLTANIHK